MVLLNRRGKSVIGAALCFLMMLPCFSVSTNAVTSSAKGSDICVVFDNSASTYRDETWYRYKHTLSTLASLIDYGNGSQLYVYPVCPVSLDNRVSSASCESFCVEGWQDISKIANMYTVSPANTSFEQISAASDFLCNTSKASNKQLVILSDGEFEMPDNRILGQQLEDIAGQGIQVHLVGNTAPAHVTNNPSIGVNVHIISSQSDMFSAVQRILSADNFFCTPMSVTAGQTGLRLSQQGGRVVIFSREAAKNNFTVTDSEGNSVPAAYDTEKQTFSNSGYENAPVDPTLLSNALIFDISVPGDYILSCKEDSASLVFLQSSHGAFVAYPAPEESIGFALSKELVFSIAAIVLVLCVLGGLVALLVHTEKNRPCQVFISYRRKGGDILANRVANYLMDRGYVVFLDIDAMHSGDFNTQIFTAIEQCTDFLLILSPNALDACSEEDDWVRKELSLALTQGKRIIPIMKDFTFPDSLPPEINAVRDQEGVNVPADYIDFALKRIEGYLKSNRSIFRVLLRRINKELTTAPK